MNNSDIIKQIYALFEESIIKITDEDFLDNTEQDNHPNFNNHLNYIKRLNAKSKAGLQRSISHQAKEILNTMIAKIGKTELVSQLLSNPEYQELKFLLHSKYENTSKKDEEAIIIEKKLSELIKKLKEGSNEEFDN